MSTNLIKIWCVFVKFNGDALSQIGRTTGVKVPENADVDDLCQEIWNANAQSICQGISPAQVQLFRDANSLKEGKSIEPILKVSDLVDCGRSYDNPLLVCWSQNGPSVVASDLAKVVDTISAPSSFSKYKGKGSWAQILPKTGHNIVCHRVPGEIDTPPVSIICKLFAVFVVDLDEIYVDGQDCMFVYQLCASMCRSFDNENARQVEFAKHFLNYTGFRLNPVSFQNSTSDGSLQSPEGPLYCNLEVKVEKGEGGGDPYMKGIAYYVKSLSDVVQNRQSSIMQYPCLHLELCGTAFFVSGIVNTKSLVICDPLGPSYQLLCNPEEHTVPQKSIFSVVANIISNPFLATQVPYPKQAVNGNKVLFEFEYKLEMDPMMYEAQIKSTDTMVIVKFCTKYNEEVHRFCHQHGFAPNLYSVSRVGHYFMVVMEKLDMRRIRIDDRKNPSLITQAKHIISTLQQKGYVHGDMRETNVLIRTDTEQLVLIDYDWAGVHGVSVYAPFLNMDEIAWPPGVEPGKPMLMEHDECLMRRLFNIG